MTEERDSFLSRWSRRKLETRQAPRPEPIDAEEQAASGPEPPESEPEITPEEIEALPRIEEITPETDISGFLRKGVPEMLRKAALRRMWALDPAIRDYVGDARDYAYDWNVLGSVPGNGPLLPTDDVAGLVERVLGKAREPVMDELSAQSHRSEPGADSADPQGGSPSAHVASQHGTRPDAPSDSDEAEAGQREDETGPAGQEPQTDAAPPSESGTAPAHPARPRHGRARPV
jgi:hypothetical protein